MINLLSYLFAAKIPLMLGRYNLLAWTAAGYLKTGVPLILFDGKELLPAAGTDDLGLFIVIPKIMYWFDISLDHALFYFFNGISACGLLAGIAGSFVLYKQWSQRLVATMFLLALTKVTTGALDVYRIPAALTLGSIPWILCFFKRYVNAKYSYLFFALLGLLIGTSNQLRGHSGTAVLLFAGTILLTNSLYTYKQKVVALSLLLLTMLVPTLYVRRQIMLHHQYATQVLHIATNNCAYHPFWQPILGGLGFLTNAYSLRYDDGAITAAVQKKNPACPAAVSKLYEQTAREIVFDFIKTDPWFVLATVGAKIGVLLMYVLLFGNIGLLTAWLHPIAWQLQLAFFLAISWSALPGIIAIPVTVYVYGFIAFVGLFALVSINHWLSIRAAQKNT